MTTFGEDELTAISAVVLDRSEEFVLEDTSIELGVHVPFYAAGKSDALVGHTAPEHQISAAELEGILEIMRLEALVGISPAPLAAIRAQAVYPGLVRPYNAFPVLDGP